MSKDCEAQTREMSSSNALSKTTSTRSWKKLEQKYLCYVGLLKTQVTKSKHKLHQQRTAFAVQALSRSLLDVARKHKLFVLQRIKENNRGADISQRQKHFPLGNLFPEKTVVQGSLPSTVPATFDESIRAIKLLRFAQFLTEKETAIRTNAFRRLQVFMGRFPQAQLKQLLRNLKTAMAFEFVAEPSLKNPSSKQHSVMPALLRENCSLKLQCLNLKKKLEQLHKQLEISIEARESDIRKKTQSLQRIALELHEKDEQLREMEKELEYYDEKERCNHGKLLTPATEAQYRLELLKQEEENERLSELLREKEAEYRDESKRLKEELSRLQLIEKKLAAKELETEKLHEKTFSLQYECSCLSRENAQLKDEIEATHNRTRKLENTSTERSGVSKFMIRTCSILASDSSSSEKIAGLERLINDRELWVPAAPNASEQSKITVLGAIEKLLEQEDHSTILETTFQKFDPQTRNKIEEISQKIKQLKIASTKDLFRTVATPSTQKKEDIALENISQQGLFDSVLDIFPQRAPADELRSPTEKASNVVMASNGSVSSYPGKSITKLQEMVLTLKDRHMAVRSIIYQLLRSLDLRKLPTEADNIISVLFDVFEYSEEEKHELEKKRQTKSFLGIF